MINPRGKSRQPIAYNAVPTSNELHQHQQPTRTHIQTYIQPFLKWKIQQMCHLVVGFRYGFGCVCIQSSFKALYTDWYIVPVPSRWEKIPLLSIPDSEHNDRHWKSIFKCLLKLYHHCHRLFSINGEQSIAQISKGIFGLFIIFQAQANGLYCSFEISQMLVFKVQQRFFSNILYNLLRGCFEWNPFENFISFALENKEIHQIHFMWFNWRTFRLKSWILVWAVKKMPISMEIATTIAIGLLEGEIG